MKKIIKKPIFKLFLEAVLLTLLIGSTIAVVGFVQKWESSVPYSETFFIVGLLIIVVGVLSRLTAGQGLLIFPWLNAESFRNKSGGDRVRQILQVDNPIRFVILCLLMGIFLVVISLIVARLENL